MKQFFRSKGLMIWICLWGWFGVSACLASASPNAGGNEKVTAFFFYSHTCPDCRQVKEKFLPGLQRKYQGQLELKSFEITSLKNFETLLKMERKLGRKIDKTPPLIIVGTDVMEGKDSILAGLESAITKYLAAGRETNGANRIDINSIDGGNRGTIAQFQNLTPLAIIGGGLLDGINPCAFATLIFLISYLTMLGRKRKELLLAGAFFTAGVFIAYFLIGFGLLELLGQIPFVALLSKWVTYLLAGIFILLCLLNLYDYLLVKQGRPKEMKLQLSNFLKQKIHGIIRERSRMKTLSAGFLMGVLVALLEFPCTGQVYFPIILILRGTGPLKFTAFWYLALYNLMFILPLIGVFGLACWGITSDQIAQWMMKHMGTVKLLMALFFGLLAFGLLIFAH